MPRPAAGTDSTLPERVRAPSVSDVSNQFWQSLEEGVEKRGFWSVTLPASLHFRHLPQSRLCMPQLVTPLTRRSTSRTPVISLVTVRAAVRHRPFPRARREFGTSIAPFRLVRLSTAASARSFHSTNINF